jgi:hypothetical protein
MENLMVPIIWTLPIDSAWALFLFGELDAPNLLDSSPVDSFYGELDAANLLDSVPLDFVYGELDGANFLDSVWALYLLTWSMENFMVPIFWPLYLLTLSMENLMVPIFWPLYLLTLSMENLMVCLLDWELTGTAGQGLCFSIPTVAVGPGQHGVVYTLFKNIHWHFRQKMGLMLASLSSITPINAKT